ncbi:flagellar motor switch protein FliG [Ethanoligenens sp.]|uniref:flagellar motor switch protein FliG n=1 Tax=Ethanoligenens sp. TaxID=2099655 RepID=UPI0039E986D4
MEDLPQATAEAKLSNKTKAALVIISLGPERAARLYQYLKDDEVETLTVEVASIQQVDSVKIDAALSEFYELCLAQKYISDGGIDYAKQVLEKAYGNAKAVQLISRITDSLHAHSFEFLKKADPKDLLSFIQYEHPQTIALILLYTTSEQAAAILAELPREKQIDVARRIAVMDRTSPEIVKEVESLLESKLSTVVSTNFTEIGGVKSIAEILNRVDRATEKYILDEFSKMDPELTEEVKRRLFVFEDIIYLDSRGIQRFLREVNTKELVVALKGANKDVADLIFQNMTKRMQDTIKEEIQFLGPVRLSEVEEAQQKVVQVIRKLEEANEIVVGRGGKDDILV